MSIYLFKRFGSLWRFNGIPVYVGRTCITRGSLVWWWPLNWLLLAVTFPVLIWRIATRKKAHQHDQQGGDNG